MSSNAGQLQYITKEERDTQVKQLAKEGYSVAQLAKKFRLTKERITQILEAEIARERKMALSAAEDFGYGDEVIAAINAATKEGEITEIMRKARIKKFG